MVSRRRYPNSGTFVRRIIVGLLPTLAVRGRRTGRWRTTPVNVLSVDGERYLVAPQGETDWVRNLRAAGVGELRRGSRVKRFRAVEVPAEQRPRILEAYRKRGGFQAKRQFQDLPDPADHPVFWIISA